MSLDTLPTPAFITTEPMTNYIGNVISYRHAKIWRTPYFALHIINFTPTEKLIPATAMKRDNTALKIENTSPFDAEFYINFKELYGNNKYTFDKLNLHIKSFTSSDPEEIAEYHKFVDDAHHAYHEFSAILNTLFPDTSTP